MRERRMLHVDEVVVVSMKTVSQLLAYLESQGHGVTARELREALEIEAEKRVTVEDLARLSKMIEDIQRVDETLKRVNELGIGHARAEERKRLQRAVAELNALAELQYKAVQSDIRIGRLAGLHEALAAMGVLCHVDSERGLTQWIDKETGDVVHERRG